MNICGVKDASGIYKGTAEAFTKANGKVTAKYTEIGATTDEARTQIVQRLEGKSTECDLFVTDVIWTSEFASQGWLLDQTKLVEANKDRLIPSTVETTKYQDKYWAPGDFLERLYSAGGEGLLAWPISPVVSDSSATSHTHSVC